MHLGGAAHELMEGDSAATARDLARLLEMGDLTGLRQCLDAADRDVLDMADDGQAEACGRREGHGARIADGRTWNLESGSPRIRFGSWFANLYIRRHEG
jgi:hypothetical protein